MAESFPNSPGEAPPSFSFLPLDKDFSVPQAIRCIIDAEFATLNEMLPVTLIGADIEGVHRVRVTIRRLRTALKFGKPFYKKKKIRAIRAELKTTGIIFGSVRDLDVLHQNFNSYYSQTHPGLSFPDLIWLPVFGAIYQAHRYQIHQNLQERQFQKLLGQLRALPQSQFGMETSVGSQSLPQTLGEFLKPALQHQLNQLINNPVQLSPDTPYSLYHGIRLLAKHHRYSLEFFSGILEPESVAVLIGNLILLQDHLGILNDCVVAEKLLNTIDLKKLPEHTGKILESYLFYRRTQKNNLIGSFNQVWANYLSQQPGLILKEALAPLT